MPPELPLFTAISLQTNQRCSLRCRFCFYGQYRDYGHDDVLPTPLLLSLFDQLGALGFGGRLALYNINEPLTDPRLLELLDEARRRVPRAHLFLSTNGVQLDPDLLGRLLERVDQLRIDSYGEPPPVDRDHPKIDFQDKRGFFARASSNRGGSLRGLPAAAAPGQGACANPFGQLVVIPPGIAVLCCGDGFARAPMGDVRHRSLEAIWYGQSFARARRLLATGRRAALTPCAGCSVSGGAFMEYFQDPRRFEALVAGLAAAEGAS